MLLSLMLMLHALAIRKSPTEQTIRAQDHSHDTQPFQSITRLVSFYAIGACSYFISFL